MECLLTNNNLKQALVEANLMTNTNMSHLASMLSGVSGAPRMTSSRNPDSARAKSLRDDDDDEEYAVRS